LSGSKELRESKISLTEFFRGKLKVYQPENGYRFSIDSILLGFFINLKPGERILELCAGSGIVSLIALRRFPDCKIVAMEFDEVLLSCLRKNVIKNNFKGRLFPVRGDLGDIPFKTGVFDVIFANPPYFKTGCGRRSPNEMEETARRGKKFELKGFLKLVSRLLKNRGSFYMIFTAFRLAELFFFLKGFRLEPKVLRVVHSYPGDQGRMILVKAIKEGGEEIRILPPLFIYKGKKQDYTEEVLNMLQT